MLPRLADNMGLAAAREILMAPMRLTSITSSNCASLNSALGVIAATPAALTTPSNLPWRPAISATTPSTLAVDLTSSG
jgi:hypothetical protein